jgi:hypothetical protein
MLHIAAFTNKQISSKFPEKNILKNNFCVFVENHFFRKNNFCVFFVEIQLKKKIYFLNLSTLQSLEVSTDRKEVEKKLFWHYLQQCDGIT